MKLTPYADEQQHLAIAWKRRSATLPDTARESGTYTDSDGVTKGRLPVCLPAEYADHNLLPDVREGALALYSELGIPWHDGVGDGPSNHLRDSQVQCTNALFPMVGDPQRIKLAFGHVLDIAEVLHIEGGRFMTFEYIGPVDYFNEGRGKPRIRGSRCTSVDAAFRYRTSTGDIELALVEWKYTESYLQLRPPTPGYDIIRTKRYGPDFADPSGPLRSNVLAFEFLLDEPFYQLMRQQLLAHRLETDAVDGATAVRVLHVLSPDNRGYQASLVRTEHRALGSTVDEVWAKLLRVPDRFIHLDPNTFLRPDVTSADYVDRYGPRT